MIRAALFSVLLAASMLAATAAPAAADSSFAGVVDACPLIVLAGVAVRSDGGITLHVEQVLKGRAAETLRFPPSTSAVEPGWARAVVAFTDPSTIARGVTFAWHVSASGALDPERLEQFPGTPQTLDAILAWFGRLPATDALPAAGDAPAPDWRHALLALAGLAAFAGWLRYRRPTRLPNAATSSQARALSAVPSQGLGRKTGSVELNHQHYDDQMAIARFAQDTLLTLSDLASAARSSAPGTSRPRPRRPGRRSRPAP